MKLYNEFAGIYDEVSPGLEGELDFYFKMARRAEGPILEVACGTGRVLLPLLAEGLDIEGFDISRRMLGVLRRKARAMGLDPKVREADMRTFRSKRRYDLIIVPYRAFNHCESSDDQIKALRNFRSHLRPGGRLVMNFFYPSFTYMAKADGKPGKTGQVNIRGKRYSFQEEVRYEPIEQLVRGTWILKADGMKERRVLRVRLSYIYKKEFELLLRLAGFRKWKVLGGFKGEKLESENQEMVWIIQK